MPKISPEQAREDLLTSIFITPTPYRDALLDKGFTLRPDEPIGVASSESLNEELRLLGFGKRDDRRSIVNPIARAFSRGDSLGLFGYSETHVANMKHEGNFLFFRSDVRLAPEQIIERKAYLELLRQDINVSKELAVNPQTTVDAAKSTPISKIAVEVVHTYTQKELLDYVAKLKAQGNGSAVVPLEIDFSKFADLPRIFEERELDRVLREGIAKDRIQANVIPQTRQMILTAADANQAFAIACAEFLSTETRKRAPKSGQDIVFVVPTSRVLQFSLIKQLLSLGLTDQLLPKIEDERPHNVELPYPSWLIRRVLEGYPLEDTYLLQAYFAELIGRVLSLPYKMTGEDQEIGLQGLREIAGDFSEAEIYKILEPYQSPVVSSTKFSQKPERVSLSSIYREKDRIDPKYSPMGRLRDALIMHIPKTKPRPEDFTLAERSLGYRLAVRKYQNIKDPNGVPPDSSHFKDGENSAGYKRAVSLYLSALYTSPLPLGR